MVGEASVLAEALVLGRGERPDQCVGGDHAPYGVVGERVFDELPDGAFDEVRP
jgi:hypothetical protein